MTARAESIADGPGIEAAAPAAGPAGLSAAAWQGWRQWQLSRPFWGALLMIAAGAELLIALSAGQTGRSAGWTGLAAPLPVAIAAALVLCGLLTWFHPVQRSVYSTVAVLLAISALMTAGVGGFLAGTLIGAAGGALGFAWVPAGQPGQGHAPASARTADPRVPGLTLVVTDGERRA